MKYIIKGVDDIEPKLEQMLHSKDMEMRVLGINIYIEKYLCNKATYQYIKAVIKSLPYDKERGKWPLQPLKLKLRITAQKKYEELPKLKKHEESNT